MFHMCNGGSSVVSSQALTECHITTEHVCINLASLHELVDELIVLLLVLLEGQLSLKPCSCEYTQKSFARMSS